MEKTIYHALGTSKYVKILSLELNNLLKFYNDRKEEFMRHVERIFKQKYQILFLENSKYADTCPDTSR